MIPRLLLLTDRSQLRLGRGLVPTVRECADAGLAMVVVRELDLGRERRHALIYALAGIPGLTVVSARTPDPAAHGVHLAATAPCNAEFVAPTHGCDPALERRTQRYMRGRSCHTLAEVSAAAEEGLDYVTLSPYTETASKPGYGPALDRAVWASPFPLPVLALGGIHAGNAAQAREAGAHGVAVMGAVMRAEHPAEVVGALLREVQQ